MTTTVGYVYVHSYIVATKPLEPGHQSLRERTKQYITGRYFVHNILKRIFYITYNIIGVVYKRSWIVCYLIGIVR